MVRGVVLKSILKKLRKEGRQRVLYRDQGTCVSCGSHEKVEVAHVVAPPQSYFLSHTYESGEEFERAAAPFYRPENMVLLCQKCRWLHNWPRAYEKWATKYGPANARELITKGFIFLGFSFWEGTRSLMRGENKCIMERVIQHMFDIYGPGWKIIFEELDEEAGKKAE